MRCILDAAGRVGVRDTVGGFTTAVGQYPVEVAL